LQDLRRTSRQIAVELFLLSAISLFVELLIIRWMSADIRAFTVFRTFPLISCFVGLGVGFALGNDKSYRLFPVATLAFCAMMKATEVLGISTWGFPSLSTFQWGNLAGPGIVNGQYTVFFLLLIIIMLALPFGMCVNIGSRLGVLFNELSPLPAYSYNVLGAIVGSIFFQFLSNLGLAPWQEILIPMLVVVAWLQSGEQKPAFFNWAAIAVVPLMFLLIQIQPAKPLIPALLAYQIGHSTTYWSPYQRIDLAVFESKQSANENANFIGLELSANKVFYQYFFNTQLDSVLGKTQLLDLVRKDYALPFTFNNSKSVLVVGAGTGQNVSSALAAGSADVDAVEIDPQIIQIGKQYNPDYASLKVHLICDDARHFFSNCKKRYDVIDFSTLDSHTVSGLGSSVRIDAYVYTKESIAKALSLLNDDGVMLISFATVAPWTRDRLFKTFTEAGGYEPMLLNGKFSNSIFILGPRIKDQTYTVPANYTLQAVPAQIRRRCLTDDWPYVYVQPEVVDYPYLLVVLEILLLSVYAGRRLLFQKSEFSHWQMFFLGSAFMLLELRSISFLSLLYGSTWVTSALVINGVLTMIFLANLVVIKMGARITTKQPAVYGVLLAAILISYFLPVEQLLNSLHSIMSYTVLTLLTILPMGVAAVIFSSAFSHVPNASRAFAFNLFGAVVGGLLEVMSNYVGIRNVLLVAMLLYLFSYLCYCLAERRASAPEAPAAGANKGSVHGVVEID
jgi:hypothetical protein